MSDIAIRRPTMVSRAINENLQTLLGGEQGYSESTNVLYDAAFVTLASGVLAPSVVVSTGAVATGSGTTYIGFVPKSESGQTALNPPYSMWGDGSPYQPRYFPHAIRGMRFAMNITDASYHIGLADGAPALNEAIIGTSYGLLVSGTSTPTINGAAVPGIYAVNVDDTTNPDVVIVDVPLRWTGVDQSVKTTAYNGIVIVQFLASKILDVN